MSDGRLDVQPREPRASGASILDALEFARSELGIPLGEAELLVARHSACADVRRASERLHDAAIEALRADETRA